MSFVLRCAPVLWATAIIVQGPAEPPPEKGVVGGESTWRDWLDQRGIFPEVFLTSDASVVAAGGADPGGTALRSLLDATISIDTGRLPGWPGGLLFADLQILRGANGATDTGDLQIYSNIDGEHRTQLAELWYEHALFDRALRIKVGKADINADFAYTDHGLRFINSSFGFSPTILGFPTYPDGSFGVAAFVEVQQVYASAGVYDGAGQAGVETGRRGPRTLFGPPADLFVIAEAGLLWRDAGNAGGGRLGVGFWHHTGTFARFDGGNSNGTQGGYLVADQSLWRPANAEDTERGLGAFAQYGFADRDVSVFAHHIGAGLAWTGPFDARPTDVVGLGATWVSLVEAPSFGPQRGSELAVELFYSWEPTPWLRIKPDVQWIGDPGGGAFSDALVLTLRATLSF